MADVLWCCHVRGADDVLAAPDYETALKWADTLNALNWSNRKETNKPPASYEECLLKAVPAIWPWSAEEHAEELPKSIRDFTPRDQLPPDDQDYRPRPQSKPLPISIKGGRVLERIQQLNCDDKFAIATATAANVGYILVPELRQK